MKTPKYPQLFLLSAGFALAASTAFAATLTDDYDVAPNLTLGTHGGTTTGATRGPNEPDHGFNTGGASIWGNFATATDGVYIFDTRGSDFNTTIGVYLPSGDFTTFLRLGAENNIDGVTPTPDLDSESRVFIPAGEQVAVAVDGVAATDVGTVVLNIQLATSTDPNDNFVNAINLGNTAPVNVTGSNLLASRELNEPIHGIDDGTPGTTWGGASIWYKWTAPTTQTYTVTTAGSTQTLTGTSAPLDTLLSVYSSTVPSPTFGQLIVATENNDSTGTDVTSSVNLNATAGTLYYIAVDGRNSVSTFQHRGNIQLSIAISPEQTIFPFQSNWEYLSPTTDPGAADTDYYTTWHSTAEGFTVAGATAYDGPAFEPPSPALIAFDVINFAATQTVLPNNAETFYVRKKVTIASPVNAAVEILADDAAVVYVDGVEKNRLNFGTPGAPVDTFGYSQTLDPNLATGNEDTTSRLAIGTLTAGTHIIAVAVHNVNNGSSDTGFDLRLYSDSRAPLITSSLTAAGVVGSPFSYTITTTPNVPVDSYGATGLPGGLTINTSTGVISGTPTAQGTTNATISATNGNGTDTKTLVITINPSTGEPTLSLAGVGTGFEEPANAARSYIRGSGGAVELGFDQDPKTGTTINGRLTVTDAPQAGDTGANSTGPQSGVHALQTNNAADVESMLFTDRVAVGSFTNVNGSIGVRTVSITTTNFEADDHVHVFLQTSADGTTWVDLGDIIADVVGQDGADSEDDVTRLNDGGIRNGGWSTKNSADFPMPAGTQFVRAVINARNDSGNEYMIFDNLVIRGVTTTPPPSNFFITDVAKVGSNGSVTFNAQAGQTYILEGSANLQTGTWTQVPGTGSLVAGGGTETFLFSWPGTTQFYVRVKRQ
jgi:hypothetical protein